MTYTLCSIMRDSAHYTDLYFRQVGLLQETRPGLRVIIGEGDSTDETRKRLADAPACVDVIDVSHGGPNYGSVDNPKRWDLIAGCVRAVLDKAGDPGDALIWVESDLMWSPHDMAGLLEHLDEVPAVAPGSFHKGCDRFYDTWGFRQNGQMFTVEPPYWHQPEKRKSGLLKIDSCGSCFVAGPETYDWLGSWTGHWPATLGGQLWLDTERMVWHP